MEPPRSNWAKLVFPILFFLPFAGGGLAALVLSIRRFSESHAQQGVLALIFGLVFCFIGFGAIFNVLTGRPKPKINELQTLHPDEPWLWRPDWASRQILSTTKTQMRFFWGFAILWNLVSFPCLTFLPREYNRGNYAVLVALLFPLAGAWLFWMAIRATWAWEKFGSSLFVPDSMPGVIGGALKGLVRTHRRFDPDVRFHVKLICLQRETSGSGNDQHTWERILWQSDQENISQAATFDSSSSVIPIAFMIPGDCSSTTLGDPNNSILWQLKIACPLPGLDYAAAFEVPVFVTKESRLDAREALLLTSYEFQPGGEMEIRPSPLGGKEFYFPPFRHAGAAINVLVFLLLFGGSVAFLIHLHAPLLFPIVFGMFTLVLLMILVGLTIGQTRVVIEGKELRNLWGVLGFPLITTVMGGDQIRGVHPKISMQSGEKVYYSLQIVRTNGRTASAGGMLQDKRQAEWVAAEISRLLGVAPT